MKKLPMFIPLILLLYLIFGCQQQADKVVVEPVADVKAESVPEKPAEYVEADKVAKRTETIVVTEEDHIKLLITQFAQAYKTEDLELLASIVSFEPIIVLIGTHGNERWVGIKDMINAHEKYFETTDVNHVSIRDLVIRVHRSHHAAWFSCLLDYKGVKHNEPFTDEGIRFTGIAETQKERGWVIVQWHISLPVSGDRGMNGAFY